MEYLPTPLAVLDLFSGPEMLLVLAFALIFFGGDKMPDLARGLAKGIREFKKATGEVEREFKRVMEEAENPPPTAPSPAPAVLPAPASVVYDPPPEAQDSPPPPAAYPELTADRPHRETPEDGPGASHIDV